MRIATFNANSIRSRLDPLLAWMDAHQPDVVCVQETKTQDDTFPAAAIRDAGWQVVFKGMKAYNGVAVLSKRPPDAWTCGFDDGGPPDEARLLTATFGPLTIINTYVPQGRELDHEMFAYKLAWFQRLRRLFDARFRPADLVLWTGDLNVARTPDDLFDPQAHLNHVCYHESVRRAFEETCAWGFVDVFRKYHPEPGQFTFFDYRTPNPVPRGIGWRIDYLLASPALAEKSTGAFIDLAPRLAPKASDHTFLVGDFDLEGPGAAAR